MLIKKEFDLTYHFPYDSYKYVFYFLDIVHEIKEGNAYNTFESFGDIKDSLKKQWAGFMYESLTKKDKKFEISIRPLEEKIAHIDQNIKKLLDAKTRISPNEISFDITTLTRDLNLENIEAVQIKINELLNEIFCYPSFDQFTGVINFVPKVWFNQNLDEGEIAKWLESLNDIVTNYKWSKDLLVKDIFNNVGLSKWLVNYAEIPYKTIFELSSIYQSLLEEDKASFVNTVIQRFNNGFIEDDGLPF